MLMKRRAVLLTTLALAFEFGVGIRNSLGSNNKGRFAVIYGTRYGATRDTSQWISKGLGPSSSVYNVSEIADFEFIKDFDHLIVGSGIWSGKIHQDLIMYFQPQILVLQN